MRYAFYAIIAGCLAGCNGFFGRILGHGGMSSANIGVVRFSIAAILYLVTILYEDPRALKIQFRHVWIFFGTGVMGQLLYSFFFFRAVTLMPLSIATTLSMTYPFFVIFLSRLLFREPLTVKKLIAVVAAFTGCAMTSGALGGIQQPIWGIILALCAGVSYSLYSVFCRMAFQRGYGPKIVSFYTWFFAAGSGLLLWREERPFEKMFSSVQNILVCLALGILVGYISNLLYLKALTKMDAGKASILTFSSPVVATLIGIVVYHEKITLLQIIGIFLIIGAVLLLNIPQKVPGPAVSEEPDK